METTGISGVGATWTRGASHSGQDRGMRRCLVGRAVQAGRPVGHRPHGGGLGRPRGGERTAGVSELFDFFRILFFVFCVEPNKY